MLTLKRDLYEVHVTRSFCGGIFFKLYKNNEDCLLYHSHQSSFKDFATFPFFTYGTEIHNRFSSRANPKTKWDKIRRMRKILVLFSSGKTQFWVFTLVFPFSLWKIWFFAVAEKKLCSGWWKGCPRERRSVKIMGRRVVLFLENSARVFVWKWEFSETGKLLYMVFYKIKWSWK